MVRVIAISNPRLALAFVDYMATQGIRLELRNSGEAAEIWLADDGWSVDVIDQRNDVVESMTRIDKRSV